MGLRMKGRKLRRIFLTGIIVVTPALVSVLLISYMFDKMDNVLNPVIVGLLKRYAPEIQVPGIAISIVSILLIASGIFFVGLLTENYIGKRLIGLFDSLLSRTPLVRGIYTAVKQFLEAFRITSNGRFHKVVAVEYPRTGMWVIGFVTSDVRPRLREAFSPESANLLNIFIPTTPNPTSGYLVMVEANQARELPITIEQAVKYIVSAGVIQNESMMPPPV